MIEPVSCPHCSTAKARLNAFLAELAQAMPAGEPQHLFTTLGEVWVEQALAKAPQQLPTLEKFQHVAGAFTFLLNMLIGMALEQERAAQEEFGGNLSAFANPRNAA